MGKEEAFTRVIRENEGVIFKITTIYTNNGVDQKDLYQEIVYQLWKSFDSFRQESRIGTWLYRVALNTAITQTRRKKKRGDQVPIDQVVIQQTDYHDTLFEDRLKMLYAHIEQLNALEKGLILLYMEGKNYEEMAIITGLSASNVGTRLSRIRQKLKTQMIKTNQ